MNSQDTVGCRDIRTLFCHFLHKAEVLGAQLWRQPGFTPFHCLGVKGWNLAGFGLSLDMFLYRSQREEWSLLGLNSLAVKFTATKDSKINMKDRLALLCWCLRKQMQEPAQIGFYCRWLASNIPCRQWEQRVSPLSHEYRLENFPPRAAIYSGR